MQFPSFPSPCFILDQARLQENLICLQRVSAEAGVEMLHTLKGFASWRFFPEIGTYLDGAATTSVYEARLAAEHMGCKVDHYAVAYDAAHIEAVLPFARHIIFNSVEQYERFAPLLQGTSAGLRVNPNHKEVHVACYDPSAPTSRLGITQVAALPKGITGLQVHALCESDSYALERLIAAIEQRYAHLLPHITWLNLGGGHLITSAHYDVPHLVKILLRFREKYPHLQVILEPSAATVWRAGVLKSTILDIVHRQGYPTAVLDVSFSCHMPDCLEMPYLPMVRQAVAAPTQHAYYLGGISCLAGDFSGPYYFEKPLQVGDELVFDDMMHYTLVRSTFFNGIPHPSLGVWTTNNTAEVYRNFGYEDYKARLG